MTIVLKHTVNQLNVLKILWEKTFNGIVVSNVCKRLGFINFKDRCHLDQLVFHLKEQKCEYAN